MTSATTTPRAARRPRLSLKPLTVQLSRKLRMLFWPGRRLRVSRLLASLLGAMGIAAAGPAAAQALPAGGVVAAGSAAISSNGTAMTVDQSSNAAILNWQSFSIGAGNSVRFNQPSADAVALNRVLGNSASEIYGSLSANGKVMLVNQNGILMGQGAQVDTGGFAGSTLNIKDSDFLAGRYLFDIANNTGGSAGAIVNQGRINTPGGYAVLIAPQVANHGFIAARAGTVAIGAGNKVSLDMVGDGLISLKVDQAALNAAVVNTGSLEASGGTVLLKASSANALFDTVINSSGIIRADSLGARNGRIVLDGGAAGVTSVSGELSARGAGAGETGGQISVLGDKVGLLDGARLDASGDAGGGTVLAGGNWQGQGNERQASATIVSRGASIDVSATGKGDGGTAVVWADGSTRMNGSIAARGGAQGGDGGRVETSGKQSLGLQGSVDISAAAGRGGSWLLDPNNITIAAANANLGTAGPTFQDDGGAAGATVDAAALGAALTGGATVNVQTSNSGTAAGNGSITVSDAVTASGSGTLNLIANGDIAVNAAISGGANLLNVGLYAGSSGTPASIATAGAQAGAVTLGAAGSITTHGGKVTMVSGAGSSLTLDGAISTGNGDVTLNAGGAMALNSTLNAGSGTVRLHSGAAITQAAGGITAGNLGARGAAVSLGANNAVNGAVALYAGAGHALYKSAGAFSIGSIAADGALFAATDGLSAAGNNITLDSAGAVTQGAGSNIAANGLELKGEGSFNLGNAGNFVGELAAGAGAGDISYTNGGRLTIGTVNSVGINRTGNVSLRTTGALGQTAAIKASQLEVLGGQSVMLENTGNSVARLTGTTGTMNFYNSTALTTGTITADENDPGMSGDIQITAVGGLTIGGRLTADGRNVRLMSGSMVQGTDASTAITAANLGIRGSANLYNPFNTISGNVASTGALKFANSVGFNIGTVNELAQSTVFASGIGNTAELNSPGTITQTAAITAPWLFQRGTGSLILSHAGNAVFSLAEVTQGTLVVTGAGVLGTGEIMVMGGKLDITGGATLPSKVTLQSGTVDIRNGGTLSNTLVLEGGLFTNSSGAGTLSGALVLNQDSASTLSLDSSSAGGLTISGNVSGAPTLKKTGTGTVKLTGNNSYTGATLVSEGTLSTGGTGITGTSSVTVDSGATLEVAGNAAIGSLQGSGSVTLLGRLNTGANNRSTTFSGIMSGRGSLGKLGTGTFTLTGASNYSGGTRAVAGVLELSGASARIGGFASPQGFPMAETIIDAGGTLAVNNGATLGGPVTLTGTLAATSGAGMVDGVVNSSNGTLNAQGGASLTLASGVTTVLPANLGLIVDGNGTVNLLGGASNLRFLEQAAGNTLNLGSGQTIKTGASQTYRGTLVANSATLQAGGDVTANSATNNLAGTLTVETTGSISLANGAALTASITSGSHTNNNASISAAGALVLNSVSVGGDLSTTTTTAGGTTHFNGDASVGGSYTLASSGAVTQFGKLTVAGATTLNAAGSDVTLANSANNFSSVAGSARNLALADSNALALGALTLAGNASIRAGGALAVNNALNAGGAVRLQSGGAITQAAAGAISAASLGARGSAVNLAAAANAVGDVALYAGAGNTLYKSSTGFAVGSVAADGALFDATSGLSALGGGNLTLDSAGAVTQGAGAGITAAGLELKGAGAFTLDGGGNSVSSFAAGNGTGALAYANAGALTVGTVAGSTGITRGGDVSLKASGGAITVTERITATGAGIVRLEADSISAAGNGAISSAGLGVRAQVGGILLNGANQVTGTVALQADQAPGIEFSNGSSYALGQVGRNGVFFSADANGLSTARTGSVLLTQTAGTVTQNAVAAQSRIASSDLTLQGNGSFMLDNASNSAVRLTALNGAGALSYRTAGALEISANGIQRTGDVSLHTGGALTQLGAIAAAQLTLLGGQAATLNHAANALTGLAGDTGALSLSNNGALALGPLQVAGALNVRAAGGIRQTGALTQSGAGAAIDIAAATGNITLAHTGNNVAGTVNLSAANGGVAFTNSNAAGIRAGNITAATTPNRTSASDLANFTASDSALAGAVVLRALRGNIERGNGGAIVADRAVLVAANRIGGASTADETLGLRLEGAAGASMRQVDVSAASTVSLFGAKAEPALGLLAQDGAARLASSAGNIFYNGVSAGPQRPVIATAANVTAATAATAAQNAAQREGGKTGVTLNPGDAGWQAASTAAFTGEDAITVPSCTPGAARQAVPGEC